MKYVVAFLACAGVWIGFCFLLAAIGLRGYLLWAVLFIVLLPAVWKGILALFNKDVRPVASLPSSFTKASSISAQPVLAIKSASSSPTPIASMDSDSSDNTTATQFPFLKEPEMTCYKCSKSLALGIRFCSQCGADQVQVCPQCAINLYAGDKFCGKCGVDLELGRQIEKAASEAEAACQANQFEQAIAITNAALAKLDAKSGTITLAKHLTERRTYAQRARSAIMTSTLQAGQIVTMDLGGGEKLELVWIAPGSFTMGSPAGEANREETQHRVTLTNGFWMGKYEVTQRQWELVMGDNPAKFIGARNPVECVSWRDCQEFVSKLNKLLSDKSGESSKGVFRLPTEAEWEYACRAGSTTPYAGNLDEMGWYAQNSGDTTHPVGKKKPNALGLYDMHGNVFEWCQDLCGIYPIEDLTDPTGSGHYESRILRGGSWVSCAEDCRSAGRSGAGPGVLEDWVGLRLVRVAYYS